MRIICTPDRSYCKIIRKKYETLNPSTGIKIKSSTNVPKSGSNNGAHSMSEVMEAKWFGC